jgi:RNA polymerase sigma-70 factor (ECF subfamily)
MQTLGGVERFHSVDSPLAFDDARDIKRAARGDLQAFNAIVERHQSTLYAIALRMVLDPSTAADITQESVLTAWQHASSFKSGSLRAWLARITVNRCYDVLRSRQRHTDASYDEMLETQPAAEGLAGQDADPAELLLSSELGRSLLQGMASLPADQRAVVVLCDVQGFSYGEAAEVEHTQIGTIKSRLSRGRARLRDWLAERPELLPAGARSTFTQPEEPST